MTTQTKSLAALEATANLAVKDLAKAREFYEGVLGFEEVAHEGDEVVTYASGRSRFNVYHSAFAGTNLATALTWETPDVDAFVASLKEKGVRFEHYTIPGAKLEGDIHVHGTMRVAWFKDPDGNILNIAGRRA